MSKLRPFDRVEIANQILPELEFVSGKWFYNKVEIKNIKKYLSRVKELAFGSVSEIEDFMDAFIVQNGTEGRWYEPSIVAEARKIPIRNVKLPSELAFPLTYKQLMIINVLLYHPEEEVFFICSGIGGSGKSTFGNIVTQLFEDDVASTSLRDLSNEYSVAEAVKHRLIYSTELSASDVAELDNKVIKQLASKERIYANPKHSVGYTVKTQSSILFNCNKEPKIDLTDPGILRRIIYYFRNEKIKNPDLSLKDKVYTRQELIDIAATALQMDMTDWRKEFEEETIKRLLANNSVYIVGEFDDYLIYKSRCQNKSLKPYSEPRWEDISMLIKEWIQCLESHESNF